MWLLNPILVYHTFLLLCSLAEYCALAAWPMSCCSPSFPKIVPRSHVINHPHEHRTRGYVTTARSGAVEAGACAAYTVANCALIIMAYHDFHGHQLPLALSTHLIMLHKCHACHALELVAVECRLDGCVWDRHAGA